MKMLGSSPSSPWSALSADTADEKVRFTDAFHKAGRGLRQSLALHASLERDLVRAAREDASHARAETERRIVRGKAEVTAHIQPLIWSEHEPPEADHLVLDLSEALEAESCDEAFLAEPVETQIARICDALGIALPAAHPREGGDASRASIAAIQAGPSSEWVPAFAGTSGGKDGPPGPDFNPAG
ncbi:MAG: hypothetical protein KGO51_09550 [Alphaproteobacteria bacterium]|nr:hypothetical protein [Alphaproteobacteria bacterium]